jgi:transcriptional regulator with XRE-family HTH domain
MKKYTAIGDLLSDFRKISKISQAEFAAKLNVDTRTIQRWENNVTLIKPEKEDDIVNETLLPYQLIRNLNANIPIPTFYDFSIRKYSLTELTNTLPQASWFKDQIDNATKRIRTIDFEKDIEYIVKYMQFHKIISKNIANVIEESIKLLPEMNLIITDDSGYYSGHSLIFPIKQLTYENLRTRKMNESELKVDDLINYKTIKKPIFYCFDFTADCNDNIYYIANHLFRVLRKKHDQNYLFCSTPIRYDNYSLNEEVGLKIIWEDERKINQHGLEVSPRFYEGNFNGFLFKGEL